MIGITGDLENTQEFQRNGYESYRSHSVNKDDLPKEDSPFKVYDFIGVRHQNDSGKSLMFSRNLW